MKEIKKCTFPRNLVVANIYVCNPYEKSMKIKVIPWRFFLYGTVPVPGTVPFKSPTFRTQHVWTVPYGTVTTSRTTTRDVHVQKIFREHVHTQTRISSDVLVQLSYNCCTRREWQITTKGLLRFDIYSITLHVHTNL